VKEEEEKREMEETGLVVGMVDGMMATEKREMEGKKT